MIQKRKIRRSFRYVNPLDGDIYKIAEVLGEYRIFEDSFPAELERIYNVLKEVIQLENGVEAAKNVLNAMKQPNLNELAELALIVAAAHNLVEGKVDLSWFTRPWVVEFVKLLGDYTITDVYDVVSDLKCPSTVITNHIFYATLMFGKYVYRRFKTYLSSFVPSYLDLVRIFQTYTQYDTAYGDFSAEEYVRYELLLPRDIIIMEEAKDHMKQMVKDIPKYWTDLKYGALGLDEEAMNMLMEYYAFRSPLEAVCKAPELLNDVFIWGGVQSPREQLSQAYLDLLESVRWRYINIVKKFAMACSQIYNIHLERQIYSGAVEPWKIIATVLATMASILHRYENLYISDKSLALDKVSERIEILDWFADGIYEAYTDKETANALINRGINILISPLLYASRKYFLLYQMEDIKNYSREGITRYYDYGYFVLRPKIAAIYSLSGYTAEEAMAEIMVSGEGLPRKRMF